MCLLAVIRYDLTEVMDDVGTLSALRTVIDTALKNSTLGPLVDPNCLVLFGHRCGQLLCYCCICCVLSNQTQLKGVCNEFHPIVSQSVLTSLPNQF